MTFSLTGAIKIAVAFLVWSTWSLFMRSLDVPAWAIVFYLSAVAAVIIGTFALFSGRGVGKLSVPLFATAVALLFNNILFFTAIEKTTVANALFTHYLAPAMVAIFAPLLLKERPLRYAPVAVIASAVGMFLIFPGLEAGSEHVTGIVAGSLSAIAYAALVIMMREWGQKISIISFLFWQNFLITLVMMPFVFTAGILPSGGDALTILLMVVIHTLFAASLYIQGIRQVSAQLAAILGYLEPVGGVIGALVVLGEIPTWLSLVGGILILAGGGLAIYEEAGRQNHVDYVDEGG